MTPRRRLSGFINTPEDLEAPSEAACRVLECAGTRLLLEDLLYHPFVALRPELCSKIR